MFSFLIIIIFFFGSVVLFCFTLIQSIFYFFYVYCRNDGVFNVKSKTKKRFNFPKKLKYVASSKSAGTPFNVAKTLSPNSIQQIRNIISFLMLEQSKCTT